MQETAIHIANIVIDENVTDTQGENEPTREEATNTTPLTTSPVPTLHSDEE